MDIFARASACFSNKVAEKKNITASDLSAFEDSWKIKLSCEGGPS